ncbi:MAG TPA: oligosaccharide flippase family protein [Prolixibacteraceae bacterium]|nr:oligosaccharide flippase family protein [Prolixibacteraceae bacterium]
MLQLIKKIVKENNFLSLVGNLSFSVFGLLGFIILTRSLSKSDFGDFVLYTAIGTTVDLFRFGLTRTAITRYISGSDEQGKRQFLGSSFFIGLIMVIICFVIITPVNLFFSDSISNQGFALFFKWYPLMALVSLPWNNAVSFLQAEQKFQKILSITTFNVGSFLAFLVLNFFFFHLGIEKIIMAQIGSNILSSAVSIYRKWDGLSDIFRTTRETTLKIFHYGKYSMGTSLGSSLLKSADTFIIGLSPILGSTGIALYAIPLKFTEFFEIPLRSFVATAFPKMSKASMLNDIAEFKKIFYTYSGAITILFIPFLILAFVFAAQFIWILGGSEYKDSADLIGNVFRIFCIYGIILPIDRLTGVALDSINKPKSNLYKVLVMLTANVIGDLIAVFIFKSIFFVALATVVFTLIGMYLGYYFLNKEMKLEFPEVIRHGWQFYTDAYHHFIQKKDG